MLFFKEKLRKLSLKWRISLAFSALFLTISGLSLSYLVQAQRTAIERSLSEHQEILTETLATELDNRIALQSEAVRRVALAITPAQLADPEQLSALIASRAGIVSFFPTGIIIADRHGTVLGEAPRLGRTGQDYSGKPGFAQALATDAPLISEPYLEDRPKDPLVILWVPIKDASGRTIALMAGVMPLLDDRFLGTLLNRHLGQDGYFYVVSAQAGVIVASQFTQRIMEPLPAPGVNRMLDRFLAGDRDSGITVNSRGVEALTSARSIPATGWILVASLPTAEAFRPILAMERQMAAFMATITVATLALLWLILTGFLRPLATATRRIRAMAAGQEPLGPLAVGKGSEVDALLSSFNDLQRQITQSQEELHRNAGRIEAIFASSPIGLAFVSENRTLLAVNAVFADIFRCDAKDLVGRSARVLYGSDEEFAEIGRRFYPVLHDGGILRADVEIDRNGSRRWLRMGAAPVIPGRPDQGVVFSVEDITQQVVLEHSLHDSEERLRLMVDSVQDYAIFRVDLTGRVASWNGGAERIKGYRADEIVGQPIDCFYPPEDAANDKPRRLLATARLTGRFEDEGWRVRRNGERFWANVVVTCLRDSAGQVQGFVTIARDLTERRKAGLEIRRLQAFQSAILTATGSAIIATGPDGMITLVNPAARRLLQYGPDDLIGRQSPDLFHDPRELGQRAAELGIVPRFQPVLAALTDGAEGGDSREWTYLRKDGSAVPVLAAWNRLPTLDEESAGLIGSAQDISALKELERDLKRSNEDLERFAYVASHDLRQPLRMVSSYLGLLERRLGAGLDQDCREFIGFAVDGAKRMDRMIIDLLDYARIGRDSAHRDDVALADVLAGALASLRMAIAEAEAEITTPETMPVVPGYPGELERLFQNLLGNAIKFRAESQRPRVAVDWREDAAHCHLRIIDNGIGIAEADQERLFTIFQRCAPGQYEGNGIGLASCRKIVERHDGRVWVESKPGQGSVFHVLLPRGGESARARQPAADHPLSA